MQSNLKIIREEVIKAVPDIETQEVNARTNKGRSQNIQGWQPRPIRLADVLATLYEQGKPCYIYSSGQMYRKDGTYLGNYNLLDDDLSHQSPECLEFLAELLK